MTTDMQATALDPTVRTRARRLVRPLLVVGGVLAVVAALAAYENRGPTGYLDPDASTPAGGQALRVLLEQRGVTVHRVTGTTDAVAAAGAGSTLLVARSGDLTSDQIGQLGRVGADLVVLDPDDRVITGLARGLQSGTVRGTSVRAPGCDLAEAGRAGTAVTGGLAVTADPDAPGAVLCYQVGGEGLVARVVTAPDSGRTTTVVGSGEAFTNDRLADEGDAALALNLLGAHPTLVWYVATTEVPPAGGDDSIGDLLPPWVGIVVLQLAFCVLLAVVWRGRRLGPAVDEPLPTDVPAAEATEGRARLYRRRRARDRAAAHLRAAAVDRMRPALGLPAAGNLDLTAVVAAAAARTGWSPTDVATVLDGGAPADDAALVRLAGELDSLERQVRHP